MTAITIWGPYTWAFLHIMAEKIKDEHFNKCKNDIINIIIALFSHLPCDYCAEHAHNVISYINERNIVSKDKLKMFLFNFHNEVSKRTKATKIQDKTILEKYKSGNIKNSAEMLYKVFHTNDREHMMNEFARTQMLKKIRPIIQKVINHC